MPNPFGGPPPMMEVYPPEEVEAARKQYRQWDAAGPHGYVLGGNQLNPKPFGDWLESLPESENFEDRTGEDPTREAAMAAPLRMPNSWTDEHFENKSKREAYDKAVAEHNRGVREREGTFVGPKKPKSMLSKYERGEKLTPAEEVELRREIEAIAAPFAGRK
jgi:hypothetical protein